MGSYLTVGKTSSNSAQDTCSAVKVIAMNSWTEIIPWRETYSTRHNIIFSLLSSPNNRIYSIDMNCSNHTRLIYSVSLHCESAKRLWGAPSQEMAGTFPRFEVLMGTRCSDNTLEEGCMSLRYQIEIYNWDVVQVYYKESGPRICNIAMQSG